MINKNTKIKIEGIPEDYTERTHNGNSKTEWMPKNVSCHDESLKFKLDNPSIGLKAELIDGEWFWVCGCPLCLEIEKKHYQNDYHICEDHNTCETCGIKRSESKDGAFGAKNGWNCKACHDRLDKEAKIEALEKFDIEDEDYDEWDFKMNDEILCPHCKTKIESTDYYESSNDEECPVCGGFFELEVEYNPSYTTVVKGDRLRLKDFTGDN